VVGAGAPGIIVITYTPASPTTVSVTSATMTYAGQGVGVNANKLVTVLTAAMNYAGQAIDVTAGGIAGVIRRVGLHLGLGRLGL
jgi:hypothetical protein